MAESFAQGEGDLANVGDLFERGRDEGREAFPLRLAQDADAGGEFEGALEMLVVRGKRAMHRREVMVEREVAGDEGGVAFVDEDRFRSGLFEADGVSPMRPEKVGAVAMPVEDLSAVEGGVEVEVGDGKRGGGHEIDQA